MSNSKFKELMQAAFKEEAVSSKLARAYVLALYGLIISSIKKNKVSAEFKQLMAANVSDAARFEKEVGLEPTLFYVTEPIDLDNLAPQGRALRKMLDIFNQEGSEVDFVEIEQMKAAAVWLINNKPTAYARLQKLAPSLNQPVVVTEMLSKVVPQDSFAKPLKKIVKTFTGRDDDALTNEEFAKLKDLKPELAKQYRELRKGFNLSWKEQLKNYVLASKKPLVDFQEALAMLKGLGLKVSLPENYEGMINVAGELFTKAGKQVDVGYTPGFKFTMNPKYDPVKDDTFVLVRTSPEGLKGHIYTKDYRDKADSSKFLVVDQLIEKLPEARAKWLQLLKKRDGDDHRIVAAAIMEFMFLTSARIGTGSGMAGGQTTYGASTLLVKHVTKMPGGFKIRYPAKGNVVQTHIIKMSPATKDLCWHIDNELKGKGPNDLLWTYKYKDKDVGVLPAKLTHMFQSLLGGLKVGLHKMRHVRGTQVFNQIVAKNEDRIFNSATPWSLQQVNKMVKNIAEQVGKELGHVKGVGENQKATGATALGSYIDPRTVIAFYKRLGYRAPAAFFKAASAKE